MLASAGASGIFSYFLYVTSHLRSIFARDVRSTQVPHTNIDRVYGDTVHRKFFAYQSKVLQRRGQSAIHLANGNAECHASSGMLLFLERSCCVRRGLLWSIFRASWFKLCTHSFICFGQRIRAYLSMRDYVQSWSD